MEVLTRAEFEVLIYTESVQDGAWDSAEAARKGHLEQSEVVGCMEKLQELGLLSGRQVTDEGYAYLEPHRVRRAILLAAGFGSRMMPVTGTTPQPLVSVNGTPFIETLIPALREKGITDITVVIGYLSEKFDDFKKKNPDIKFLYNGKYSRENNISSAMLVSDRYSQAYVMDADLFLVNRDLIRKYEYSTNYLGVPVAETDDWCLQMEGDRATGMKKGGTDTYLMVGLSYWSREDGEKFHEDIQKLYATEAGKQNYWDDVALTAYVDDFRVHVRPCTMEDIYEIDSIEELAAADPSYEMYLQQ